MRVSSKRKVVHTPDEILAAIKRDLNELRTSSDPKDAPAYSLAIMASVFYEMDAALKAGATQRQVLEVFSKNKVSIPYTRFAQNLARLRGFYPEQNDATTPDETEIKSVSADMQSLTNSLDTESLPVKKTTISGNDRIAPLCLVSGHSSPKTSGMPMHEKVIFCANLLLDIAKEPACDFNSIKLHVQSCLGKGWTPQTVVQFASSVQFAHWCDAHWPENVDRKSLLVAHQLACSLLADSGKVPSRENFVASVQGAFELLGNGKMRAA